MHESPLDHLRSRGSVNDGEFCQSHGCGLRRIALRGEFVCSGSGGGAVSGHSNSRNSFNADSYTTVFVSPAPATNLLAFSMSLLRCFSRSLTLCSSALISA